MTMECCNPVKLEGPSSKIAALPTDIQVLYKSGLCAGDVIREQAWELVPPFVVSGSEGAGDDFAESNRSLRGFSAQNALLTACSS